MVLDIIFLLFAIYGFYIGYSKGIIGTVFTLLAYTFGIVAGVKFAPFMTNFLNDLISDNPLNFIAGFVLSFVFIMIVIRMIAKGLESLLETANINVINKFFGGALLTGAMILLYSVLLWFADSAHLVNQAAKEESRTYAFVEPIPAQAYKVAKQLQPTFEKFWEDAMRMMDRLQDVSVEREEGAPNVFDLPDEEEEQ